MTPRQQHLVVAYQWLASRCVRRYARRDLRDELEGEANYALCVAAATWTPAQGYPFVVYASLSIRRAVIHAIRRRYGRVGTHRATVREQPLGFSNDLGDERGWEPATAGHEDEVLERVWLDEVLEEVRALPLRQREAIAYALGTAQGAPPVARDKARISSAYLARRRLRERLRSG